MDKKEIDSLLKLSHELKELFHQPTYVENLHSIDTRSFATALQKASVFFVRSNTETWVGLKSVHRCSNGGLRYDFQIHPWMLFGRLIQFSLSENGLIISYCSANPEDKSRFAKSLASTSGAEIYFPFLLLDVQGREIVCPPTYWEKRAKDHIRFDLDEKDLRSYSIRRLKELALPDGARIFDPACSTGTFLKALSDELPQHVYVGSDCSPEMIRLAEQKLDECFVSGASEIDLKGNFDVVFLRLLCMEVVTQEEANKILVNSFRWIKKGGYVFVIGHNPIIANISSIAPRFNIEILSSVGVDDVLGAVFQFYILKSNV
jgi:hypothetical protein